MAIENGRYLEQFDNWNHSKNSENSVKLNNCNTSPDPIIIHTSTKGIRGVDFNC